jgi:hypothetical protein
MSDELKGSIRFYRLLLVFVWCSPVFQCEINLHQEGAPSVVPPDSDPKMALLQPFRIPEAALDHRRIAC